MTKYRIDTNHLGEAIGRVSIVRDGIGDPMTALTRILSAQEQGGPQAGQQLLPLVYDKLRQCSYGPRW